jgi:hypothetical protein
MKLFENKPWLSLKKWMHKEFGIKDARLLVGLIVGLILVLMMTDMAGRLSDLNRLNLRREEISTEVMDLKLTQSALETQVAHASSDAAVADWARTYGRMKHEGDNVVVPIPPVGTTPMAVITPAPTQQVPEAWEVWEALFFGK